MKRNEYIFPSENQGLLIFFLIWLIAMIVGYFAVFGW